MDGRIIRTFCDKSISENLGICLNEQRKKGEFCDFTIETEDGGSFSVHKCVINAKSLYFQNLFNSGLLNSPKLEKEVSSSILEKVIEYLYTGKIEISSESAKDVLRLALDFNLITLISYCTQVLTEMINVGNCFDLLNYSETHVYSGSEELQKHCIEFIMKNFNALGNDKSKFLNISSGAMKKLLSFEREDFSSCDEESLFSIMTQWILYDKEVREQYFGLFVDQINSAKLSNEFCVKILKGDLLENHTFRKKTIDILGKKLITKSVDLSAVENELNENDKKSESISSTNKNLNAIIGNKVLLYDYDDKKFSKFITSVNCSGFGFATFGDQNLFFCGGKGYVHKSIIRTECEYFSLKNNMWKQLPPMQVKRNDPKVETLNDRIYVLGGDTDDTVEIFDVNSMQWSFGSSLYKKSYTNTIASCSHNGCIYVINRYIQFLDPRQRFWSAVESSFTSNIIAAVSFNNSIYAFDYGSVHEIDVRYGKVKIKSSQNHKMNLCNIFVTAVENKIYFTGYEENKNIRLQQFFDKPSDLLALDNQNLLPLDLSKSDSIKGVFSA